MCGRFIAFSELNKGGGASSLFVPDSHVSYEEEKFRCKKCTELHGVPIAKQSVNDQLCSRIH